MLRINVGEQGQTEGDELAGHPDGGRLDHGATWKWWTSFEGRAEEMFGQIIDYILKMIKIKINIQVFSLSNLNNGIGIN